jgi:hypothetical protein
MREQPFNAEQADKAKRVQGKPLYINRTWRARYDKLVLELGYSPKRLGALLTDMIEFYEQTTPEQRAVLLASKIT